MTNDLNSSYLSLSLRDIHGPECGEGVLRSLHGHKHSVHPTREDRCQVSVPLHRGVQHAERGYQKGELGTVQPHAAL